MNIQRLTTIAFLLFASVTPSIAKGDDALVKELRAMTSEHIMPLVEKRGGGAIAVGGFTAATSVRGGAGPEIQMCLSGILREMNAKVDSDDYRYEITGNYLPYEDKDSGLQGVKLVGRLVDAEDGTTLGEFPRFVFGPESVPRMLGLSVSSKGTTDPEMQSVSFRRAMKAPRTFMQDSQISASPSSQYSIEILSRQGNQFRPFAPRKDRKSRPFVDIPRDQVYAVRLINHSDHDAAVQLTIDGVNVFAFSQQSPKPKYWIVPAKKNGKPGQTLVRGWDKNSSSSFEFKVVDFPSSAAARVNLRPSSNIGLITACFSACWEHERDRPRSEGRTRATGFGKEIVDRKTRVQRHIGQVRDVITIRYERDLSQRDPIAMR